MDIPNVKRMNDLYKRLMDEIDIGVHVIDEQGKTIIYNRKMMHMEAMNSEEVLDKKLGDVFKFHDQQNSTLLKALQEGVATKNVKQTYFNNKGREITTINDTFPIQEDQRITGAMEIAKDVTQLERVIQENVVKKKNTKYTFDQLIGNSAALQEVVEEAKRSTRTSSSVLIVGDTGSGKELFAQSIHNGSSRSGAPFISQNCAAIPDSLMESLLFGTKKGAFTGATDRPGLFEEAEKGTLLLDEINSLNPSLQAKLLRVLQEKSVRRLGDTEDKTVDVRIITTLNEDPLDAIANHRLRKDLYYRLSVVSLFIPPLKERREDIAPLVRHFIYKYNTLFQMDVRDIDEEVRDLFDQHDWPGNVRELEHVIEGAMNVAVNAEVITPRHLPMRYRKNTSKDSATHQYMQGAGSSTKPVHEEENMTLKEKMNAVEQNYINKVLSKHEHNISQAAKELGISRQSLQYRIKKFQSS
ncbi:arginine utilization regulatory protein [Geomicrobium halophilum]|uniref:Arginine utilization regulatory protein n=1 Tax=Geomicrobium halophilum TaxID=549000 RepID=A0A841PWN6_9BACL|nr:sigma 54-interacting transcriptional regulator [Geomicrobium halophilum]MBB6448753.1 arginine utilization regulatory protein [Geomicrobium halophilum]